MHNENGAFLPFRYVYGEAIPLFFISAEAFPGIPIEPLECGLDLVVYTPCDGIAEIKRYGTDHSIEMPYNDLPAHKVKVVLSAKLGAH